MLAIVIGTVAVAVVGLVVYGWISGQFKNRKSEIARLEGDIRKLKQQVMAGQMASQKISGFEARSFPKTPEVARMLYHDWLLTELEDLGLAKPKVNFQNITHEKGLFAKQVFNVSAEGTLPQLVDFLHAFYSRTWLHRITTLNVVPTKDNHKLLQISLTLDAVSLLKAKDMAELDMRTGNRLALPSIDDYRRLVISRNTFGPENQPPAISVTGGSTQTAFLGRTAEVTIKATDPDALDKVEYRLVESSVPDAKMDARTGKLTFSPKAEGKYEFVVEGLDDGYPRLASKPQTIVVNVTPQPAENKLAFDDAKYTVLVGVIDIDGKGEVWLHRRAADRTVVLHVGDKFEVGSIKGTVTEIGESDFSFDMGDQRRKLAKGEFLIEAKAAPKPAVALPAAPPAEAVPVQASGEDRAS
jgi:hypothetical protein